MILRCLSAVFALLFTANAFAADVSLESARAQFLSMHTEEAQRQFEALQSQNPNDAAVLYYLGRLALRQYHRKTAVQLMRKVTELAPNVVEYRIGACEAIAAYIDDVPFYRQIGLAEEVHKHLKAALLADPRAVDVHDGLMKFYLGAPMIMGGGRDKAEAEAAQLMALDDVEGHIANSVIAIYDKRYGDAERQLRIAVQIAPRNPVPRYELGKVQQLQRHYEAAFDTFDEIAQLFPSETAAYYYYANTVALANQRLGQGLEKIKIYLARGPVTDDDPSLVAAYRVQGRLSELASKLDAARSAYQTALRMDPADAETASALQKLD